MYFTGLFGYTHLDFEADRNKGSSGDPSLVEMTVKAIHLLQKNPRGFFLLVEGKIFVFFQYFTLCGLGRPFDELIWDNHHFPNDISLSIFNFENDVLSHDN